MKSYENYLNGLTTAEKMELNNDEDGDYFNLSEQPPVYSTFYGSFQHIYLLTLGEFGIDDYEYGGNTVYSIMLHIYFYAASFFFVIHLLNMLIAIMSEAFSENNKIK